MSRRKPVQESSIRASAIMVWALTAWLPCEGWLGGMKVYLVMYFLTNFILSYASVYRQLYDGHCPEYTCQLSKDTEVNHANKYIATVHSYIYTSITPGSLVSLES